MEILFQLKIYNKNIIPKIKRKNDAIGSGPWEKSGDGICDTTYKFSWKWKWLLYE